MKNKRIFVSLPADQWLTKQENRTKWAIVEAVEGLGYTAEIFLDPRGTASLAAPQAWSALAFEEVMRRCEGCVILGFPRWRIPSNLGEVQLPTEFNHYEGAVAYTLGLPLLVFVQAGVLRRVVFDGTYKGWVGIIPPKPTPKWLTTSEFTVPFGQWRRQLDQRRDVFLGYCSASEKVATQVADLLKRLGHSVLDWAADFDPANTILTRIAEAAGRCGAGIFLFTKDDELSSDNGKARAAPRDNVVFEAGYFIAHKDKPRVLIVRESGAKMPADLGGDIYASFDSRSSVASEIEPTVRRFLEAL